MRQKMKFGGGIFPPPQGLVTNYPGENQFGMGPPQGLMAPSLWLPFSDSGSGIADTTEVITRATPTFARATTAWTRLSSLLWTEVASGSARSYYTSGGMYAGWLQEGATTNRCLHSRDLTNVVWVAVTVTAAKNQVGIDGVANSCSLLTADANGGTLLQTVVSGSAARTFSCFMKRSVGTGAVSLTLDGGVSSTDISGQLNSSTFTLVQIQQTVTNPVMGFIFATSGDAVIIDMCQEETFGKATTPYPAGASAATRNRDTLTYPLTGIINNSEGVFSVEMTPHIAALSFARIILIADDGTTAERNQLGLQASLLVGQYFVNDGNVTQVTMSTANSISGVDGLGKLAIGYKANNFAVVLNGSAVVTDVAGSLPTTTTLRVGGLSAATTDAYGAIRNLRYFNRRLSNSQVQALTA